MVKLNHIPSKGTTIRLTKVEQEMLTALLANRNRDLPRKSKQVGMNDLMREWLAQAYRSLNDFRATQVCGTVEEPLAATIPATPSTAVPDPIDNS